MKNYINTELLDETTLDKCIKISTMSATCSLSTDINLNNVYEYMKLVNGNIVTVKYKGSIKSLEKIKKRRKNKKINSFHNQLTVEVRPDIVKLPDNKISIKIFRNGSIQMSGVKSLHACNLALNKLIENLNMEYGVVEEGKINEIKFINGDNKITEIVRFKVDMINSNFKIGYQINREELYNILLEKRIQCRYEPCIHACVNIKFKPINAPKNVSIFVFQSGSIIITGAKNMPSIIECYNYITKILGDYKHQIQKTQITDIILDNMNSSNILKDLLKVDGTDDLASLTLSNI